MSRTVQTFAEEKKLWRHEAEGHLQAHHRMPDGKLIAVVQVCLLCRRKYAPERGRKYCPVCQGLLIGKTMVLKIP